MKKNRKTFNLADIVLSAFAFIAVILVLVVILFTINLNKEQASLTKVQDFNTSLQQKYDNLAPNKISLPAGKFPLEANEKLLDAAYTRLMAFVYQKSDSVKIFDQNKDTLIQYFGHDGYEKLKSETLLKDGKATKSLSNKLLECNVAFSDFNLDKKTVAVSIYSNYELANPSGNVKTGVSLITLTYNFADLSVSDFDIHSTNVEGALF